MIPEEFKKVHKKIDALQNRKIPYQELIVTQTLSREINEYRVASAVGRAAQQLQEVGKTLRMGQPVRYIHIIGRPGLCEGFTHKF